MATKYLQANQAMSTLVVYTAASGGSISTLDAGDDLVLNGYTLTLDAPALPASGTLSSITDFGKAGYVSVPLDTTGNCAIRATTITPGTVGANGFIQVTGTTTNTLTITGSIAGGGASSIGLTLSGTGIVNITGSISGGPGVGRHGAVISSTGTLTVVGNVAAGTSGYGINVTGAGTVTITGNVDGGSGSSGYGVSVSAAATVAITGTVTGGSGSGAYGLLLTSTSTMTVTVTGSVYGGAGSGAVGVYNTISGDLTVANGHLVNSATALAYCGLKPFTWTNAGAYYLQWSASGIDTKFGKEPAAGELKAGVVCGDVTGTRTDCPAESAWNGAQYGDPGSPITGTKRASSIQNCGAANVKSGITIDDVTGTLVEEHHTAAQILVSAGGTAIEEHHTDDEVIEAAGGTAVEEHHTPDQVLVSAGGTAVEEHHNADEVIESAGGNFKEPDPATVWHGEPVGLTVGTMHASDIQNCVAANILAGVVVDDVEGSYEPPEAPDPDFVLTTATPPGNWIPAADEDVRAGTPNGLSSTGTLLVPTAATPMSMLEGCYNDEAVLWRRTGMDSHGKDLFMDPEPVFVRWQQRMDLFIDKTARERRSRAVVYAPAGVNIGEGDRLALGRVNDLDSTGTVTQSAWPVLSVQNGKALDGTVVQQKAWL